MFEDLRAVVKGMWTTLKHTTRSKKDAQDAHEAIRPTDVARTPDSLSSYLSTDEQRLYRLIWQRSVASQMTPAIFDQTTIDIGAGRFIFRACLRL